MVGKNELTLEKLKVVQQLEDVKEFMTRVESYMSDGTVLRARIEKILDDNDVRIASLENTVDGKGKEIGLNAKVKILEDEKSGRDMIKDTFLKAAIGSLVLSIGSFCLWLAKLIWTIIHSQKGA